MGYLDLVRGHEAAQRTNAESRDEDAVERLRAWLTTGALAALPDRIPGFADELTQYADRDRLIGMVRAILDAAPWSLTAQERAKQFAVVLTPLMSGYD